MTAGKAYARWMGVAGVFVTLLLTGCSTTPSSRTTASADGSPSLPAAKSGRGGYYKDDGPGDQTPTGLGNTPDATPRIESPFPRNNRPYTVFGNTYTPMVGSRPYKERGIGSWYGKKFHGQKTSSGEIYDMYKMTAAHTTLPLPSYARVTNQDNGKQVIVRVNDRGPFHANRIIDLSYTAALKLGYLGKGSGMLEVELLLPDEIDRIAKARQVDDTGSTGGVVLALSSSASQSVDAYPPLPATMLQEQSSTPKRVSQPVALAAAASGYYLQLGAFSQEHNAQAMREQQMRVWKNSLPPFEVVQGGMHYRLFSGPFASRDQAIQAAHRLREAGGMSAVVVQR